jgi:hypothetical protein
MGTRGRLGHARHIACDKPNFLYCALSFSVGSPTIIGETRLNVADEPTNTADAQNVLASRLMEEYKILQDKIDKIGAFRFTIKGWSITVIIASIFAGTATKAISPWFLAISLIFFLAVFFFYERQQTNLSYHFGRRVLAIEAVLSRLLRTSARESGSTSVSSSFVALRFVPGIGHIGIRPERKHPDTRNFWQSCKEADGVFYLLQILLVLAFVICSRGAQRRPDHASSESITISNTPTVSAAQSKNQQSAGTAQVDRTYRNEKKAENKEKQQSH